MRRYLLLITLIIFFKNINAQYIDTAFFKADYTFEFRPDSITNKKWFRDSMQLSVGKNLIAFTSLYYEITFNELKSSVNKVGTTFSGVDLRGKKLGGSVQSIYGLPAKKIYFLTDELGRDKLCYRDTMPIGSYTILNDTCTILGYHCQKATTTYRGRNYILWFAKEIPIPYGPYKFYGLPGLILSVQDDQNQIKWICVSIKKTAEAEKIKFDKNRYVDIPRTKFYSLKKVYVEHPEEYAKNNNIQIGNMDGTPLNYKSRKYYPIELE